MTKCFTGVALMKLVENRQVKLDDNVADYLTNLPQVWRKITIKQMLTHTSGLPDIVDGDTGKMIAQGEDSIALAKVKVFQCALLREKGRNTIKPIMYYLVRLLKNFQKAFYHICNRTRIYTSPNAANQFRRFF